MNLSEIRNLLPDYADGELAADIRTEIETALAAHPELRAEVTRWQALRRSASRIVNKEPVPAGLADRVRTKLRSPPPTRTRFTNRRILYLGLPGLAVAAGFILVLTLSTGSGKPVKVEVDGFARVYRDCAIANRHDTFGVRGMDPASAYAKIKSQAAFACNLLDLTNTGEYHIEGACQCPPGASVRAVHAYFQSNNDQNRIVSVFAIEQRIALTFQGYACGVCSSGQRPYTVGVAGPITLLGWRQGDQNYVLAAEMPESDLMRLADGLSVARLPQCNQRTQAKLGHAQTR